jgi:integrase
MLNLVNKRSPLENRLRKRKGVSTYSFWGYDYAGKRYETTTHQTDKVAALNSAREIERERAKKPEPVAAPVVICTLARAFELLQAHDIRVNAKPNTVDFHNDRAKHLLRILKPETLCSPLMLSTVLRYTDTRLAEGADRHTIQKEHRVLRQALKLAHESGECPTDGSHLKVEGFVKARQFYKPGDVWLSKVAYISALLAELPPEHRDEVMVYLNLGLRRRELLTITPGRVDLAARVVRIECLNEISLKNEGAERELPLNDAMVALFTRLLATATPGAPLFVEWASGNRHLSEAWERARKQFLNDEDLPESLCFNDLRRTFCSLLKNAGVSFEDCAELLGHEDLTMVRQVYGHTQMSRLAKAVTCLPSMTV